MAKTKASGAPKAETFTRFTFIQRISHIVFLITFSLLGFTGLPQKFPQSPISIGIFDLLGGVENARLIHHTSAVIMLIISLVHILDITYGFFVLRKPISMIPWFNDLQHVINDVLYYIGVRKHKGYYGRYSYAEKMEYLAVIWGTAVMALTGFMMWNPITTVSLLPGESIPAAKAAHGGEAVLAVLAIIIWHYYNVHIKTINKSMFTGNLDRHEMEHEHPAELAGIDSGIVAAPVIPVKTLRLRRLIYAPFALVVTAAFGLGIFYLVGVENTAISTMPTGETAQIFSPLPSATPRPTPTPAPFVAPSAVTWEAFAGPLFVEKCSNCHGINGAGGLNLLTYQTAIKGGSNGPDIVGKDSASSKLVQVQSAGGHPGQLSADELTYVKKWIDAGAPEK